MQLYALDSQDELIAASIAEKQKDYFCIECGSLVRVKKGSFRHFHFYHLSAEKKCHLSRKGLLHIKLQYYLKDLLPDGETKLEVKFKEVGRIADVVWHQKKIVFEIQCSPISAEEIKMRTQDYQSLGFTVVWILHDKRFNKKKHTLAERQLLGQTHYFTNFDVYGNGIIYDQFAIIEKGQRTVKFAPLPIDISKPNSVKFFDQKLLEINRRLASWKIQFDGDMLSSIYKNVIPKEYIENALLEENLRIPKWSLIALFSVYLNKLASFYLRTLDALARKLAVE